MIDELDEESLDNGYQTGSSDPKVARKKSNISNSINMFKVRSSIVTQGK